MADQQAASAGIPEPPYAYIEVLGSWTDLQPGWWWSLHEWPKHMKLIYLGDTKEAAVEAGERYGGEGWYYSVWTSATRGGASSYKANRIGNIIILMPVVPVDEGF